MADYTYDATLWTQEQKNSLLAVVVAILWNGGVSPTTYTNLTVRGTDTASVVLTVTNPSVDPTSKLTQSAVETRWTTMKSVIDTATAAKATEDAARATELATNPLYNATIAQIDTMIDNAFATASTAAQIKAAAVLVLKRIARYVRARGV